MKTTCYPEEIKLLDLLVTLIDRYEETHYTIKRRSPHEILQPYGVPRPHT
ncbi:MAG: hypothetical protein AB7G68_13600 [Nitrospiraceae bacterium]